MAAVAIAAAVVWRVTTPPGNHASPASSNQATGRLSASNGISAASTKSSARSGPATSTTSTTLPPLIAAFAPPPPSAQGGYIAPHAVWTSYSCVANGFAWEVAYVVQFSGGSGWQSLDGGTTTTEHWGVPPKAPGVTGTPEFSIGIAQVWDTVNNQGRFVNLANPITIHCPARG